MYYVLYVFIAFIFNQLFVYHRLFTLSYYIADADNPYVTRKSPLPTSRGRSRSRSRSRSRDRNDQRRRGRSRSPRDSRRRSRSRSRSPASKRRSRTPRSRSPRRDRRSRSPREKKPNPTTLISAKVEEPEVKEERQQSEEKELQKASTSEEKDKVLPDSTADVKTETNVRFVSILKSQFFFNADKFCILLTNEFNLL